MSDTSENRFRGLATAAAFASLFSYAVVFTITSACINQVGRFYHASPSVLGWLFRALMVGFFTGILAAGRYSDRHGKLKAIWPGCLAMAVGLCVFGLTTDYRIAVLSMLLMGLGGGFSEGTAMALITDLYSGPRRTAMANWSQSMFGFGAIACPLAVGWLLRTGVAWQASFFGGAVVCILSAVLTLAAMASGHEKPVYSHDEHSSMRELLSDRLILLLAVGILLYVGAETGTANWLAVYFKQDLGSSAPLAAWSIAIFWSGITVGRIAAGWVSRHMTEIRLTKWCLGLGAVFQALLLLVHSPFPGLLSLLALGLCFGPIFPTLASCSSAAYPRQSGMAMGIVVASGAIGGAIFPPTIGVLADHAGMRLAMWVSFVILTLNLGMMMTLRRRDIGRIAGTAREAAR